MVTCQLEKDEMSRFEKLLNSDGFIGGVFLLLVVIIVIKALA